MVRCGEVECGGGDRERDLGPRADRVDGDELVRMVGVPAPRAEAVDGERDVVGHVAGVAGAAAPADLKIPPEQRRRRAREPLGDQLAAVHPRPAANQLGLDLDPVDLPGPAASTGSNASSRSARRSQVSSPSAGTTLNASPERSTVGVAVSRSGPAGSPSAATLPGDLAEREQRVAALLRRGAGVGGDPVGDDPQRRRRPCAWRPPPPPRPGPSWPASKHRQAS